MSTQTVTRKFRADTFSLDKDFSTNETSEFLTIEPVTIAREGVFPYEDGRAYKPGNEMERAAEISRIYFAWGHPPLNVITKRDQIKGFIEGIHIAKDGAGVRVKGTLSAYKNRLTVDQAEQLRSGIRRDLSTGFYYEEDRTPGEWGGQKYDYIQRELLFDHVASVDHGRCAYPACGIGVDAPPSRTLIGNDPYPNEHSCRMKDPAGFQERSFRRLKRGRLHLIIGRPEGQRTTTLQAFRYPKSKWSVAEARAHCREQGGQFEPASSDHGDFVMTEQKSDYSNLRGSPIFQPTEVSFRNAEPDGDRCGDCVFFHGHDGTCQIVAGPIGAVNVCDEFLGRPTLEEMVQRMHDDYRERFTTHREISRKRWDAVSLMQKVRAMSLSELVNFHRRIHAAADYEKDSLIHRVVLFAIRKKR